MLAHESEDGTSSRWRSARNKIVAAAAMVAVVAAIGWGAGVPQATWFKAKPDKDANARQHAGSATISTLPIPQSAGTTDKRLHLLSTVPGRNVHEGTAQLGVDLRNPQTYGAGAWLENGATLREIHADHVVIERDGQSTELYVEGLALGPGKKIPKANQYLLSLDQPAPPVSQPTAPPTYTDIIRAAPHFEGEMLVGFDVYPGSNRTSFAQSGLQSGDLLTAIDGVPMNSTEALHAALQSMRDGQIAMASISRQGQSVTMALQVASERTSEAFARTP
jgi:hypothetical protein